MAYQLLWRSAGINTPEFELIDGRSDFAAVESHLGLPLFVKPANEGSSIGISKVKQSGELGKAYELAAKSDPLVIAEKFIGGGEYTVGIWAIVPCPLCASYRPMNFMIMRRNICGMTPSIYALAVFPEKEAQIQAEALRLSR